MSNVPEGAQLSDDGHWWWDGAQWQPVHTGELDERAAARAEQGLPPALEDVSGEQRAPYLAEPTVVVAALEHDEIADVPEMEVTA